MEPTTNTIAQVDLATFNDLFFTAQANFVAEVVLLPKQVYQTREEVSKEISKARGDWKLYAGILGAAQYSLPPDGQPVGVLARENRYFRPATAEEIKDATPEEMLEDLARHGPTVVGEKPTDDLQIIIPPGNFWSGKVYLGIPRLERIIMATAVFPGNFIKNLRAIADDLDGLSEIGEMIELGGYYAFYAESCKLYYHKFCTLDEIDAQNLTQEGRLQGSHGQFVYVPLRNVGQELNVTKWMRKGEK